MKRPDDVELVLQKLQHDVMLDSVRPRQLQQHEDLYTLLNYVYELEGKLLDEDYGRWPFIDDD